MAKPGIAHNEDITPRNLPPRQFSQFETNYGLDDGKFVRDVSSVSYLLEKAYSKFAAWFTTEPEPWHPDKSYQICASFPGLNNQKTTFNSFVDQNLAPHGQKWPMEKFLVYLDHEKEELSQWIMNYEFIEKLVKPPTGAYSQDCIAGLVKGFYLILNRVNELKVPPPSTSTLERGVLTHFEFCTLNVLLSKLFFRLKFFIFFILLIKNNATNTTQTSTLEQDQADTIAELDDDSSEVVEDDLDEVHVFVR